MTPRIVCCGIATLDQIWVLPALPAQPGKYIAEERRETGGGMAATAAVAVAALGGASAWCGRLGADAVGRRLLEELRARGIDCAGATVAPAGHTPNSAVMVDPRGERILAVFPGSGLPADAPVPAALLAGARAALADPRWVEGADRLFAMAGAQGIPRVLDADIAPREALMRLAAQADHAVFSERGLVDLTGEAAPDRGLAAAAGLLGGTVAVTLGARGSLWWRNGVIAAQPAPTVLARDTTGCGDVFHGAYALAIAEGAAVMRAARFATAAAALKARNGNGWAGMPDRAATEALLAEAW